MSAEPDEKGSLPLDAHQRVDQICDAFERAWRAGGERPCLEGFLGDASGPERAELLRRLLELELDLRVQAGESPMEAEYRLRFPTGQEPIRLAFHQPGLAASSVYPSVSAEVSTPGLPQPPSPTGKLPHAWPAIDGYEILEELGRGGTGVVYKARHLELNRLVALKMVLAGAHAGREHLARFQCEAQAIARLQHPNIVQVFEVGEHKGLPFLCLELCPGGSLDRKLAGTPLPPLQAAHLVAKLAQAVQVAHEAKVIHRDLKPANVLLAQDGTPKVSDFGLARRLDQQGQTVSGLVLGTPSYMAPEQAAGKGREAGPPADVYALGAILYECLTGRPPFRAASPMKTLSQVLGEEPAGVRQLQPGVPLDLETVCLKCLHKEPARRYASAQGLAKDLERFLTGEPVAARPIGRIERLLKWGKRQPAVAALLAVTVLAVVSLLGAGLLFVTHLTERNAQLTKATEEIKKQKDETVTTACRHLVVQIVDRQLATGCRPIINGQAPPSAPDRERQRAAQPFDEFWAEALRDYRFSTLRDYRFSTIKARPARGDVPDQASLQRLKEFQNDPRKQEDNQLLLPQGKHLYYGAVRASKSCLACHQQAEPDLAEGDLIAVIKIEVPTESIADDFHFNCALLISTALVTTLLIMAGISRWRSYGLQFAHATGWFPEIQSWRRWNSAGSGTSNRLAR